MTVPSRKKMHFFGFYDFDISVIEDLTTLIDPLKYLKKKIVVPDCCEFDGQNHFNRFKKKIYIYIFSSFEPFKITSSGLDT